MRDRLHQVKRNPLYDILAITTTLQIINDTGLERTYQLFKSNKVLKRLRADPGVRNDLCKIDHNRLLDLYPQYEYIFGPYVDSNAEEFNLVYLLFTNRINMNNELKVVYAGRILQESEACQTLPFNESMRDEDGYIAAMDAKSVIPGKLSQNCYYRQYHWSSEEVKTIMQLYNAVGVGNPSYNSLRENFTAHLHLGVGNHATVNVYRLLYEVHHAKRRLTDSEVVSPINGRKADLRPDNVTMRDLNKEDQKDRQEAMEKYGLDTYTLEKIYAKTGFNRFRGIYTYTGKNAHIGNVGRRYVKLVQNGTDNQHTILLARALMTVKENRILSDEETVDHIDHNSLNDVISNLRIVSRATHSAEDKVRLEIDPVICGCCGTPFTPSDKLFSYLKLNPVVPYCKDSCLKAIHAMSKEERTKKLEDKKITYRYYVLDKDSKKPRYFPDGMEYKECRTMLMELGEDSFVQ